MCINNLYINIHIIVWTIKSFLEYSHPKIFSYPIFTENELLPIAETLVKTKTINSNDPTNWIFEASELHIPPKARARNERKYYQTNTIHSWIHMGPTEINKGNARNYTLPTRSKSTITKTHTNFKKREREKQTRNSLPGLHEPIQGCLPRCRQRRE